MSTVAPAITVFIEQPKLIYKHIHILTSTQGLYKIAELVAIAAVS